jgi:protein TonB
MQNMSGMPSSLPRSRTPGASPLIQRGLPLAVIIIAHVAFFFALQSGLARQTPPPAGQAKTVFASFITPEPPKPVEVPKPKPEPTPPKPKPVVKKKPKPQPPPVIKEPSEKAITTEAPKPEPEPEPEPVEPAEPVRQAVATAPTPPAASPAPPAPAQPRLLSSGIQYIKPPQLEYPAIARRMREEGKVLLRVLVNTSGRPEHAEVQTSSGSSRLDEAAKRAAMRAVFKPHIENGRPVAVYALIPINFQLDS